MSDPLLLVIAFGYILLSIDKTIKVFTKRKGKSRTTSQYVITFIMIFSLQVKHLEIIFRFLKELLSFKNL